MAVVRLEVEDLTSAREAAEALRASPEVEEVRVPDDDDRGIGVETVVLVIVGIWLLTKIADWNRARGNHLLVIDTRGDEVVVAEHPELEGHQGKVVIITEDGTQVRVETPEVVNLDEVVQAVKQLGVGTVATAVEAAGSEATVLGQADQV